MRKRYGTIFLAGVVAFFTLALYGQHPKDNRKETNIAAKELVGVWQADDSVLSADLQKAYRFYSNGTYEFNTNEYDLLHRILSFRGTYRVEGTFLYTTITSRKELVGGSISRGGTEEEGEWVLQGGTVQQILQDSVEEAALIERCTGRTSEYPRVLIHARRYYKLSDNPNDYEHTWHR